MTIRKVSKRNETIGKLANSFLGLAAIQVKYK